MINSKIHVILLQDDERIRDDEHPPPPEAHPPGVNAIKLFSFVADDEAQ
jgi:hypothetical protein